MLLLNCTTGNAMDGLDWNGRIHYCCRQSIRTIWRHISRWPVPVRCVRIHTQVRSFSFQILRRYEIWYSKCWRHSFTLLLTPISEFLFAMEFVCGSKKSLAVVEDSQIARIANVSGWAKSENGERNVPTCDHWAHKQIIDDQYCWPPSVSGQLLYKIQHAYISHGD